MGRNARVAGRWIVALVAVSLLAAIFAMRSGVSVGPAPPRIQEPTTHAAAPVPDRKTAAKDPAATSPDGTRASDPSSRLLDAYLFFFAAFESHRARGAGGLGHPAQ
jgi:hypothetical protein